MSDSGLVCKWHAMLHILYQQDGNMHTKEHQNWQKEWSYTTCSPYALSEEQVKKIEENCATK